MSADIKYAYLEADREGRVTTDYPPTVLGSALDDVGGTWRPFLCDQ